MSVHLILPYLMSLHLYLGVVYLSTWTYVGGYDK